MPKRPVDEKAWLKETGMLPLGTNDGRTAHYDARASSDGGCDAPEHFEGCHAYYVKVSQRDNDTLAVGHPKVYFPRTCSSDRC